MAGEIVRLTLELRIGVRALRRPALRHVVEIRERGLDAGLGEDGMGPVARPQHQCNEYEK